MINNTTILDGIWKPDHDLNTLHKFSVDYGKVHGYISLLVCFFGIPTNVINVTVLTRRHMQTSINLILTWMAVSDMLTMVSYVPFAIHFYIEYGVDVLSAEKNTKLWMEYLLFHVNFSATTHTISIWLGVSLAIFRFIHLQSSETGNLVHVRRIIRARIAIFAIIACSVLLLIPNYLSTSLKTKPEGLYKPNSTGIIYITEDAKIGTPDVKLINFLNMCLYSIFAKFVPCFLMIIFGGLLLRTLDMQVRVKRRKMTKLGVVISRPLHTSRTTVLLLVVMILFLITELPQGILILLSLFKKDFFGDIYIPLGDVMDMLALVNNAINFVLYCSMNREFRRTLLRIMSSRSLKHYRTHAQTNGTGTEMVTEAVQKPSLVPEGHNHKEEECTMLNTFTAPECATVSTILRAERMNLIDKSQEDLNDTNLFETMFGAQSDAIILTEITC